MKISDKPPVRWNSFARSHIFSFDKVMVATTTYIACVCPNVITASILGAVLFFKGITKWQKQELLRSLNIILPVIFVLTLAFGLAVAHPAQGALFDPLKEFVSSSFPGSTELVELIFNVISFLLVSYFAVSIVLIIKGIIDGQPIASLVQTPITIVLVVVITEIIIPFLV